MDTYSIKEQLLSLFNKSKKDRHRFLDNHLSANIGAQIFSLRTADEREWTQARLADEAGIAQPRIPVYESPDYGAFSLKTLKKLAYAFDTALLVKFVSFDELAKEIASQSAETSIVRSFANSQFPQEAQAVTQTAEGILRGDLNLTHLPGVGSYFASRYVPGDIKLTNLNLDTSAASNETAGFIVTDSMNFTTLTQSVHQGIASTGDDSLAQKELKEAA